MSRKSFGPESEFLHKLKGKDVTIREHGGEILEGKLVWVDTYTLGFLHRETPRRAPYEEALWKHHLLGISAGIASEERRGYESQLGDENERPTATTSA